jgi:hypothetical protein
MVFHAARVVRVPSLSVSFSECVMPEPIGLRATIAAVRRKASASAPSSEAAGCGADAAGAAC